jgi:hypothetical protein
MQSAIVGAIQQMRLCLTAKERKDRPGLDAMFKAVARREVDMVIPAPQTSGAERARHGHKRREVLLPEITSGYLQRKARQFERPLARSRGVSSMKMI